MRHRDLGRRIKHSASQWKQLLLPTHNGEQTQAEASTRRPVVSVRESRNTQYGDIYANITSAPVSHRLFQDTEKRPNFCHWLLIWHEYNNDLISRVPLADEMISRDKFKSMQNSLLNRWTPLSLHYTVPLESLLCVAGTPSTLPFNWFTRVTSAAR